MSPNFQEIRVIFDSGPLREEVGILAVSGNKTLFEYDPSWVRKGIELSPVHMPIGKRSFQFESAMLVNSVPGLCADSLPDGWGLLIMDRFFLKKGIRRHDITPLDRLAYLGNNAMGALCYQPSLDKDDKTVEAVNIGAAAHEAYDLYEGKIQDAGHILAKIGGSPGGARPKALVGISECGAEFVSGVAGLPPGYSHWMVKFSGPAPSQLRELGPYEGILEYIYLKMAEAAGISVPGYRLISDEKGLRHIAVRRFDRPADDERLHVATAFGLLHADYRVPSIDYKDLLRFAWVLTKDATQVSEQFRRAVFNMLAVNRDDHSRNHGYLMNKAGDWQLSPAYDLTFSKGPGGGHWTSFYGEGKNPSINDLLKLAELSSIGTREATTIIEQVKSAVENLPRWCKEYGIPGRYSRPIIERVNQT